MAKRRGGMAGNGGMGGNMKQLMKQAQKRKKLFQYPWKKKL